MAGSGLGPRRASGPCMSPSAPSRFWWEFHQAVTALVYSAIVVPAWYARGQIGGWQGRAFFIALRDRGCQATTARLHLWFTSRFYPQEPDWYRDRVDGFGSPTGCSRRRWSSAADVIGDERSPLVIVLPSAAVGVVAFLLIEPVTTRDAFKRSGIAWLLGGRW